MRGITPSLELHLGNRLGDYFIMFFKAFSYFRGQSLVMFKNLNRKFRAFPVQTY